MTRAIVSPQFWSACQTPGGMQTQPGLRSPKCSWIERAGRRRVLAAVEQDDAHVPLAAK